ncbi:hypothetical protein TRFO_26979 [Tritrichomonas foetus]|uniref:Uncharacterized protein n=1 Tax=Tritrichomonas foetus TaxID=1144522 RepID=A0A1J4K2U7_9EUKA|nr:hypothetical protein TRFO_26979 [Tritrichomonas foetus]|eukprot:OHT05290.1 hypothetical protein TRFO_26979 [Tritrichomonas foetus]
MSKFSPKIVFQSEPSAPHGPNNDNSDLKQDASPHDLKSPISTHVMKPHLIFPARSKSSPSVNLVQSNSIEHFNAEKNDGNNDNISYLKSVAPTSKSNKLSLNSAKKLMHRNFINSKFDRMPNDFQSDPNDPQFKINKIEHKIQNMKRLDPSYSDDIKLYHKIIDESISSQNDKKNHSDSDNDINNCVSACSHYDIDDSNRKECFERENKILEDFEDIKKSISQLLADRSEFQSQHRQWMADRKKKIFQIKKETNLMIDPNSVYPQKPLPLPIFCC